jgi:hypothetical protein
MPLLAHAAEVAVFFFNWHSGTVESTCVHWALRSPMAYCASPSDYDDGEVGGMIGRSNRSTRRKPAAVPLCPPQTPHAARKGTRAAAVRSQRLTA